MKELQVPEFKNYEEEAAFWDDIDTADFMEDDGGWFRFETPRGRLRLPKGKVAVCLFSNDKQRVPKFGR